MTNGSRKRGRNEGSIYKRKDGRWAGTIDLGFKNGKRHRKTFYGKTRKSVSDKLVTALNAHRQSLPVAPERMTVKQFLESWLEDAAKPALRPRTYEGYRDHINNHLVPALGHIQLSKLTAQHVQQLLNDKIAEGLSPRTVHYMHAVLRRALNQAVKWDYVVRNVATLVDRPRAETREIEPLTPEQARTFLKAVEGDRLEALYTVALALGLRKGEALGLRWSNVDLENAKISITGALQRIDRKLQIVETKTRKSRRTIAMPESLVAALRRHRARQKRERLKAGQRWQEHDLVFTTSIGTPLEGGNVSRHLFKKLEKAGLPRKRFHDLRHTCASLLLAEGVHPRVVMDILGHSEIGLTMNTYSHVIPALQQNAARLMGAVLGETK